MKIEEKFMRRALQLARNGEGRVSPNPMVGAVIVHDGKIIGEGFHSFYGGPHAEVNAINSVNDSDKNLLGDSTMYVTLEPCSHFGKTPPCANLIVKTRIPRVIIGSTDPNPKVAGNGIKILEENGIETCCGLLEDECKDLNRKFMHSHTSDIPWILLKWAQSSDGFMASINDNGELQPVKFSTPVSSVWMHRLRSGIDAIMVGKTTEIVDSPRLDNRLWGGNSPKKFVADSMKPLKQTLAEMKKEGVSSLMVEGGPTLLKSFIEEGFYNEIRVETSPIKIKKGTKAPAIPSDVYLYESFYCGENIIQTYRR